MFKSNNVIPRHVDNHLEYLQGKRTWAETYEPTPKAFAFTEPWHNPKYELSSTEVGMAQT